MMIRTQVRTLIALKAVFAVKNDEGESPLHIAAVRTRTCSAS